MISLLDTLRVGYQTVQLKAVSALANGPTQVMRDNPEFLEFLMKEVSR